MRLVELLEDQARRSESYFRQHLAREDMARIGRLLEMARASETRAAFLKDSLYIGWTKDDMRTHELRAELETLNGAIWSYEREGAREEEPVLRAWEVFDAHRMKTLIHCL